MEPMESVSQLWLRENFMAKVKLTIVASNCRSNYHCEGDSFVIGDICPPICHELWNAIYPSVMVLMNNGDLDYGDTRAKFFESRCPDNGRVLIRGEVTKL